MVLTGDAATGQDVTVAWIMTGGAVVAALLALVGVVVTAWLQARRMDQRIGAPKDAAGGDTTLAEQLKAFGRQLADVNGTVLQVAANQGSMAETMLAYDGRMDATERTVARIEPIVVRLEPAMAEVQARQAACADCPRPTPRPGLAPAAGS